MDTKKIMTALVPTVVLFVTLAHDCPADNSNQVAVATKQAEFFHGQTIAEIQQLLGKPNGTMTVGEKTVLLYSGESLAFIGGKWINPQPNIRERIANGKIAAAQKAAAQKAAAAKEKTRAAPPPPQKKVARPAPSPAAANEYGDLVTPGQITVVDFYATWCGPCKRIAPILDRLVSQQSGVVLNKVDIGDWGSGVADKYNIQSVPNIRVFDRQGRMVGAPTSDPNQVARYIERAKQSE